MPRRIFGTPPAWGGAAERLDRARSRNRASPPYLAYPAHLPYLAHLPHPALPALRPRGALTAADDAAREFPSRTRGKPQHACGTRLEIPVFANARLEDRMLTARRLLAAGLLTAAAAGATACATYRSPYRYPARVGTVDDRAYQIGYDEGRDRGEDDARRRRPYDYARHGAYRDADDGYRGYGDRNAYRSVFRQGFVAGYNDGFRRYAQAYPPRQGPSGYPPPVYSPGGRGPYGSPAAQNGYRDGYQQGLDDRRDGDRFDPVRATRYREGDHDYNSRYGSRDDYKREYRAAFQQGYSDGYYQRRR
jgi:hypothetical protein